MEVRCDQLSSLLPTRFQLGLYQGKLAEVVIGGTLFQGSVQGPFGAGDRTNVGATTSHLAPSTVSWGCGLSYRWLGQHPKKGATTRTPGSSRPAHAAYASAAKLR
jgi:hypothetical protein